MDEIKIKARELLRELLIPKTSDYFFAFRPLSTDIAAQSALTASLGYDAELSALIAAQSAMTGSLGFDQMLSALIEGQSTLSATLQAAVGLKGVSIDGQSNLSATLQAAVELQTVIAAQSALSATLQALIELDTTITAQSSVSAAIQTEASLSTFIQAQSTLAAVLQNTVELAATITAQGNLTGALQSTVELKGVVIAAQSALTGSLEAIRLLNATVTAQSAVSANLGATVEMDALIAAQGGLSAALGATVEISTLIAGQSTVAGDLVITQGISVLIAAQSTLAAALQSTVEMSATIAGQAGLTGALQATVEMKGVEIDGQSALAAVLFRERSIDTTIDGQSALAATLFRERSISATIDGQSALTAALQASVELKGVTIDGQSTLAAALQASVELKGVLVAAQSALSSSITRGRSIATTADAQSVISPYLLTNIFLYLPMGDDEDDQASDRTLDISGNTLHADFGAGSAEPTKLTGNGYSFDGSDDYMSFGTDMISTEIDGAAEASFEFVIKYDDTTDPLSQFFSAYINGSTLGVSFSFDGSTGNEGIVKVGARSQAADSLQSCDSLFQVADRTCHIVGAIDFGNDLIYLYIDGNLETTFSATFGAATYTAGTPTSADLFGETTFEGNMLFCRANTGLLSAADALHLYQQSLPLFPFYITNPQIVPLSTETDIVSGWGMKPLSGTVYDVTASNNDGTVNGDPEYKKTLLGDGMYFDGTGDYVDCGDDSSLELQEFTISVWIKNEVLSGLTTVCAKGIAFAAAASIEYFIGFNGTTLWGGIADDADADTVSVSGMTTDVWYHVVFTVDSADLDIYVNGAWKDNETRSIGDIDYTSTLDFFIGGETVASRYFTGDIVGLKIFDDAKSREWILNEYEEGKAALAAMGEGIWTSSSAQSGALENSRFTVDSGTFEIAQETIDNGPVPIIENVTAGVVGITNTILEHTTTELAYGTWIFWMKKDADASNTYMFLMASESGGAAASSQDTYAIKFDSDERIKLVEINNAVETDLFATATSFIDLDTWYGIKVVREYDDTFYVYYKSCCIDWRLIDISSGSNPVSDSTITTGTYLSFSFGAGDMGRLISKQPLPDKEFFQDVFSNTASVTANGGSVVGSPTISNGVVLDGSTQYITYALDRTEFYSDDLTIILEFDPDTAASSNVTSVLMDCDAGARHLIYKKNNASNNVLGIRLGGTALTDVPYDTYGAYWNVGESNLLVVSGTSGTNNAWLNKQPIMVNEATAWTKQPSFELHVGSGYSHALTFDGTIYSIKVLRRLLTNDEVMAL